MNEIEVLEKLKELDKFPLFNDAITEVFVCPERSFNHSISKDTFLDSDNLVFVEANISDQIKNLVDTNTDNYVENVTKLLPFCHLLSAQCHTLTKSKSVSTVMEIIKLSQCPAVEDVWSGCELHSLLSSLPAERVCAMILATARLEWIFSCLVNRRLQLKDNLMSAELREKLGVLTTVFQCLLGCVKGFNIKNLTWHGFVSLDNIPEKLYSFLFCSILSLNQKLKTMKLMKREWTKIPDIKFSHNLRLDKQRASSIITNSHLIHPQQLPLWHFLLDLRTRTDKTLTMLNLNVVLLQHVLRRLWVAVSSVDRSRVTADSSLFYVTFDEIFSPVIVNNVPRPGASYYTNVYNTLASSSSDTQFLEILGTFRSHALLDIFVHGDGPRLRDKLSHSEIIRLEDEGLAHYMFDLSLSLLSVLCPGNITQVIKLYCSDYKHQFHPACQMDSLINKATCEVEHLEKTVDLDQYDVIESDMKLNELCSKMRTMMYGNPSDLLCSIFSKSPLFVGPDKMKYYNLFKTICLATSSFSESFYQTMTEKLDSYRNGKMRSRQRKNLLTGLGMLQIISFAIKSVKIIVIVSIIKTESLLDHSFESNKEFVKLLRQTLKCFENCTSLVTQCKWLDISKFLTEYFYCWCDLFQRIENIE